MKKVIVSIVLLAVVMGANVMYLTFFSESSKALDRYPSMTSLMKSTKEGVDWKIFTKDEKNATVIVAPHGGGIEPGTTEIAGSIAKKSNSGYYTFEGLREDNNSELHVTSSNYDEPKAQKIIGQSKRTVTIHRTSRKGADVYIGGRDSDLKHKIKKNLTKRGFKVENATGDISGKSVENITNKNKREAGVQLEISSKTISRFFKNGDYSRVSRVRANNWSSTMDHFTDGVVAGLKE